MKRRLTGPGLKIALITMLAIPRHAYGLPAGIVPALAPVTDPASLCEAAVNIVQTMIHTPPGLLDAIATVESGRQDNATGRVAPWPWTIDANGSGHAYATEAQAVAAAQAFESQGINSLDIGCMQVNLLHHPDAFDDLAQAFDPLANVIYGARFLRRLKLRLGGWNPAVAAYHSETPSLGLPYEQKVLAVWHGTGQGGNATLAQLMPVAAGMTAIPKAASVPKTQASGAIPMRHFGVGGFAFAGLHGSPHIIPIAASVGAPGTPPAGPVGRGLAAYRSNPIPIAGAK